MRKAQRQGHSWDGEPDSAPGLADLSAYPFARGFAPPSLRGRAWSGLRAALTFLGMTGALGAALVPLVLASRGWSREHMSAFPAVASTPSGIVWGWGTNEYGQLGDATLDMAVSRTRVRDLVDVTAVAGGASHSLALAADGAVWSWGWNRFGQLGDGTFQGRWTPVRVAGLPAVTAIAAGAYHSIALGADGSVWCWGFNGSSQTGQSADLVRPLPSRVAGLPVAVAVAAGSTHSLALAADGTVWSWGNNADGALGTAEPGSRGRPALVAGLPPSMAIGGGLHHGLAIATDGSVWAWGLNSSGQLGHDTPGRVPEPRQVPELRDAVAVLGGAHYTLALASDGTVWAWGDHGFRESLTPEGEPRPPHWAPVPVLDHARAISAGYYDSLVLRDDGSLWGWSARSPNAWLPSFPVPVTGMRNITAVASGGSHALAVQGYPSD